MVWALLALVLAVGLPTPAHAELITLAILGSAFVAAHPFIAAAVTTAITFAVSAGVGLLAQSLMKPDRLDRREPGVQLQLEVGDDQPLGFIVGRYATAGTLKFAGTWGEDGKTPNAFLTQVIQLTDLPIAFDNDVELWVNDEKVTILWDEAVARGAPVQEYRVDGDDSLWIRIWDGTQGTADNFLVTQFGEADRAWESTAVGTGCAYAVVTARWDREVFNGYPRYLFEVPGIRCYDLRKDDTAGGEGDHRWDDPDTWELTENPAVIVYNIIRGIYYGKPGEGEWLFGGQNLPAFRLPAAEWIAAANACDEEVNLAVGGTEPRFRCGAEIRTDMEPLDVIEELLKTCEGRLAECGGLLKPLIGVPGSAVYSFTDDDIVITEGQTLEPFPSLDDTHNGIAATYPEPRERWTLKDAPQRIDDDLVSDDGDRLLVAGVSFPYCPHHRQVQRLMRAMLKDERRFRTHSHFLPPDAWILEPNDIVAWSSERNGYVEKKFIVARIEGARTHCQQVVLREIEPEDYDWSTDFELPASIGDLQTVRPPDQAIVDWFAEPYVIEDPNTGAKRPAIALSWDGTPGGDIVAVRWQVRLDGETDLISQGRTDDVEAAGVIISHNLLPAVDYEVRGKYVAAGRRRTLWSNWLKVTTPDVRIGEDDLDTVLRGVIDELERETLETRAAVARGRELAEQFGAEAALARIAAAHEKRERQLAVMDEQRARASVGASLTREIMASVEETFVSLAYFKEDIEVLAGDGISIAEFLQELGSEVRDEETGLEAKANISTLQQTLAEIVDNEAWAWAVEASDLVAQVTDEETGLDTKASIGSLNQTFAEIRDNEAWAWAQEATDLIAQVTDEETGLDAKANISIFQKVLAEFADGSGFAWAVTLAETDAAVRDVETGLETKASITDLQELDTSLDPDEGTHALAVRVQTISSQVGQTANSFPDPMGQDPAAFAAPATHSATGWAGMLGGGWQITASGSNQASVARDWIAASPGMEVTLSCKARVVGGDTTMALHIQTAQDAAGTGATNTSLDTTNSNTNVTLSGTHEMPAGHFFFRPRIVRAGGGSGQARWGEVKCLGPDILAGAYGIISRMQTVETTLDDGAGGGIVNDTTELKLEVFGDGGSNVGLINQVSNIEGDLDNMELYYGIHLSNNGKLDGLSLLSTSHGSGPSVATLDIVFDKVRFAVNDADNSPVTFLKVESGQIKLDGDLLATGSVKAGALAARSITLGNLAFQGFGNLVANPGAEAGVLAPHADNTNANGGTWSAETGAGSRSGAAFFRYNPAGQTGPSHLFLNGPAGVGPEHVFCKEGDQFQFSFWARSVGSGNAPQVRSRIEFRNASGIVGSSHSSAVALTSSYQKVTHAATAPAGATYVVFMPRVDQVSGAALVNVDDCDARQVITDGGLLGQTIINGGHIKTDEVFITDKLQIGDLVIDTNSVIDNAITDVEVATWTNQTLPGAGTNAWRNVALIQLTALPDSDFLLWGEIFDDVQPDQILEDGLMRSLRLYNQTDDEVILYVRTQHFPARSTGAPVSQSIIHRYTPPSTGQKNIRWQVYGTGGDGDTSGTGQLVGMVRHK